MTEEERVQEERIQEDMPSDKYICFTKVWGVTYSNRQEFVQKCQQGQELELEITASPHYNFGSDRAIAVFGAFDEDKGLKSRTQLGFLQHEIAEKLIPSIQHGKEYQCFVEKVTGGSDNKSYFGLNIKIIGEPIGEYEDIPAIQNGDKQLTVSIDGRDEEMSLYEYYKYLDNVLHSVDAPNGNKQLTVLIDGRYKDMSLYEYYKYLDSVPYSAVAPIYIISRPDRITATSEAEYDAYRDNLIMDYDYGYDEDDGDYYSEEDMW